MKSVDLFRFSYSAADARSLLAILLGIELVLVSAYVLTHIIAPGPSLGPLRNFLDVDRAVSIPTWFSSVQLFALGVCCCCKQAGRSSCAHLSSFWV